MQKYLKFAFYALITGTSFQGFAGNTASPIVSVTENGTRQSIFAHILRVIKHINHQLEQLISKRNQQSLSEHVKQLERLLQEFVDQIALFERMNQSKDTAEIVKNLREMVVKLESFIKISKQYQDKGPSFAKAYAQELQKVVDLPQLYGKLLSNLRALHQQWTAAQVEHAVDLAQFITVGETLMKKWNGGELLKIYEGICHRMSKKQKAA